MDLVQPFSGFPDANWYDCGRRSASPAVPPPRGPLTKSGSTGTPGVTMPWRRTRRLSLFVAFGKVWAPRDEH